MPSDDTSPKAHTTTDLDPLVVFLEFEYDDLLDFQMMPGLCKLRTSGTCSVLELIEDGHDLFAAKSCADDVFEGRTGSAVVDAAIGIAIDMTCLEALLVRAVGRALRTVCHVVF